MTTHIYLSSLNREVAVMDSKACESMLHLNMMINKLKGDLVNAKSGQGIFKKSPKHPCRSASLSLVADFRAIIKYSEFMLREQISTYGKRPTRGKTSGDRLIPGIYQGY
jgi:hypothetical protein